VNGGSGFQTSEDRHMRVILKKGMSWNIWLVWYCATNEAAKDNVASVQKRRTAISRHSAEMWGNYSRYNRITFTKSPSFCKTSFSASLTQLTPLLAQSHDGSCYVSRPVLTPPPLWLQKNTDLRAHEFAHPSYF